VLLQQFMVMVQVLLLQQHQVGRTRRPTMKIFITSCFSFFFYLPFLRSLVVVVFFFFFPLPPLNIVLLRTSADAGIRDTMIRTVPWIYVM
jgi:hypothetical protein